MKRVATSLRNVKLGDIIELAPPITYGYCTVKEIRSDRVTLFRPYTHAADFSCGGKDYTSVICYVGVEEFDMDIDDIVVLVEKGRELL